MSLSAAEIALVVARWNRDLAGAFVRKAISPAAADRVALELYLTGGEAFVEIVLAPRWSRLCRVGAKPDAAEVPHPFVMLLRREAVGLRLEGARQLGGDRVVALDLAGGGRHGTLVCELLSRHGNLFWLGDDGLIAGSFHPNRSQRRLLVPGQPYAPPTPHPASEQAHSRFADDEHLEIGIAALYAAGEVSGEIEEELVALAHAVRKARKRLERLAANLERDRAKAAEAERLQAMAHVLQANLKRVPRGAATINLVDFEGRPIAIPLDPSRDAGANMTRLFEKAKRLRRAAPRIDERAQAIAASLAALAALAAEIAVADESGLAGVREEIARRFPGLVPAHRAKRGGEPARLPFHEIGIAAGRTARVGRSAADNDALTLRHARPDDLWLHVRGEAGSHVVVPLGRGEEPTEEMLVDAAHLAAFFSKAKERGDVEVTYTRRRYVQKPKGAPAGGVRLLREKTIFLKVEPERIARLLGRDP
jgi:predicted ribosome quality control (RQC) complex YloA/Tae2 family protein